ncbi:MAG TPA: FtsX-like permease family protein, partial [Haloplasmataceae bacterium]
MKKLISKLKFIIRMAYKNIIYSKFRALILFITFIILFLLTIMSLSTKSFLNAYFYHNLYAKYKDINLHITYDENSFARFFSIKPLNEAKNNNEILAEEINYIAAFFEITTVFELNDEVNYVNVMASNIDNFKKVCNLPNYIEEIKAQEIIINKEFSKKYNIYEGDEIYLAVGSTKLAYKVIAIIPIDGLMSNNTVFIDKDSSISYFLKALGFNIISNDNNFNYTRNLYNHIYISIKDEHRLEEVKENIQNIKEYKDLNLVIENTIDMDIIDKYVTNFGSIMLLIIVFIFIAIIYVMQSTLNLIFEEHKSQIGIIQTLGGRKRFSFSVILTEMLMYFIPASYISYLLTQLIVNQGLKYIKSTLKYQIPTSIAFISCIIVLLVIILITLYNFIKIIKKSSLVLSLYNLSNKKVNPYISIIMFILSIFTYIYN